MRSRAQLVKIALASVLALSASGMQAQSYPTKPIQVVVPYAPAGTSDILARVIGQKLTQRWSQQVVVVNKPGANGNVGADLVARSAPDGYTLLLADIGALCISPGVFPALPFDPLKDFQAVVLLSYSPHILGVHPSLPVRTVRELIDLARARPGRLNFAMSGLGGAPHLAGIEFALRTGIEWTYVPYKGGSQALADVVAGHADVLFNGMLPTYPFVKNGKLRALAVSSARRVAAAPGIPTVAESGLAGFETGSWQGVLAPAGTPRGIVDELNAGIRAVLAMPEVRQLLADQGTEVRAGTPEAMAAFMRAEVARWRKVVERAGVRVE